jgi:hypothetical protein
MKCGSLVNLIQEGAGNAQKPVVGMGITCLGWTDRMPMTIVEVNASGNQFVATHDDWERIDSNGMSECQEYKYTSNPDAHVRTTFRRAKNGKFYSSGGMRNGRGCILGRRERYYDFSF